jgi:hypothetical protein
MDRKMTENRAFPDQYLLRMPEGMRDRLKAEAQRNGRSMNAEIALRLGMSLDDNFKGVVLQALFALRDDILDEKLALSLTGEQMEVFRREAEERGLSLEELASLLVTKALDHIERGTEVGRRLEARAFGDRD